MDALVAKYGLTRFEKFEYGTLSAFAHPDLPVLAESGETPRFMSWGLIPPWAKERQQIVELRKKTLNARSETAASLPSFRESWKSQRCIILLGSYIEYRHEEDGSKTAWFVDYPAERPLLRLAGLWSRAGEIETCTILTTEARGLAAWVHNSKLRQPVVLKEDESEVWIRGTVSDAENLCKPRELELEIQKVPTEARKKNIQGELF